jgi:hypothetical protein
VTGSASRGGGYREPDLPNQAGGPLTRTSKFKSLFYNSGSDPGYAHLLEMRQIVFDMPVIGDATVFEVQQVEQEPNPIPNNLNLVVQSRLWFASRPRFQAVDGTSASKVG